MMDTTLPADTLGRKAIIDRLTAAGAPFALHEVEVHGVAVPAFVNAPPTVLSFIEGARQHGASTFLVSGEQRLDYASAFARADALAAWLVDEAGVRARQPVAIAMRNGIEWVIAFMAVIRTGATAVLVNSRGAPAEMRAALEDAGAELVLADVRRSEALVESGWTGRIVPPSEAAAASSTTAQPPVMPDIGPDDIACILFTSGTTGRAKGAMLSHQAVVQGVMNGQMAGAIQMERMVEKYGADVVPPPGQRPQMAGLLVVPLFHIGGVGAGLLAHIASGGKLVFMARWNADEALRLIEQERLTALTGVPTMLWDVLRSPVLAEADLSSLTAVSTGGQGLALNLLEEIRHAFPRALLGGGWGMTETCGAVSLAMGDDYLARPTSAGYLLPTWRLRVLGSDGQPVATGEIGEMAVQGVSMLRGYSGLPEASAEAIPDGWLRTGDLGSIDEDGYVFVFDRKKDMVISGGENIYCAEVESTIARLADVLDVASFGVPDARLGERLVAAVVVAESSRIEAEHIRAHAAVWLADYKVPSEIIVSYEALPRNAAGKIEKRVVRERHLRERAQPADEPSIAECAGSGE